MNSAMQDQQFMFCLALAHLVGWMFSGLMTEAGPLCIGRLRMTASSALFFLPAQMPVMVLVV